MSVHIVMINSKFPHNVGGALRACSYFGANQLIYTGSRVPDPSETKGSRLPREERMKGYKDVVLRRTERPLDFIPETAVPVAVEFRPNSEMLPLFKQPEDVVFFFGPEDGSLPHWVLCKCHRFVIVPTLFCMNLSSTITTLLYDRMLKRGEGWSKDKELLRWPMDESAFGPWDNEAEKILAKGAVR